MADQKLTDILFALAKANANNSALASPQTVKGLSNAILSSVPLQKPYTTGQINHADPRGPSVVNRILDLMSRPLYATLNAVKSTVEEHKGEPLPEQLLSGLRALSPATNPGELSALWQGLSGKEKTTGKDVVGDFENQSGRTLPGPAKAAVSFGLDILADPLTYAGGVGLLPKLGKGAKASTEALKAVEEGTGKASQELAGNIARNATRKAEDLARPSNYKSNLAAALSDETNKLKVLEPKINLEDPSTQLDRLKVLANPLNDVKNLNAQIAATKSPITKSLLRKQIEKMKVGVTPADMLTAVRETPVEFPAVTIGSRWIDTAKAAAEQFMKTNRLKNINPVGQTNLYNKLVHAASKVRKDRRSFTVMQMLRVAEDHILSQGRHLVDSEGVSVRLSDLANIMGGHRALSSKLVDDFRKARPNQALENLKAVTVPKTVTETLDPVIKTGADIAEATKDIPPSQTAALGSEVSKELAKIAENAGASSKEAGTAKRFVDELFNPNRDQLYSTVQQEARNLVRQSASGVVNPETLYKVSTDVYKALGSNPKVLGRELTQNKVVEGIMTRFATWWNAKDLKPFSREYIDTARNVAAAFAETIKPLIRMSTKTERQVAFSVAAGKVTAGSTKEAALAQQFQYMVERLLGTHGITDNAESVLYRSGTVMKELNDVMPKEFQFINTHGMDKLGREFDYTNGQWMHSWKEWTPQEPAEALYQLTRSLQLVTRKNSMWDDAIARWGLPKRTAEFQHAVDNIPRLKGTYFPKEIATQLSNLQRQLDRDVFKSPHKAIELFDKVQRMWKTGVTIYSPSHHIRNLNGDIYLSALDGVISPKPYAIATKVLHAFPTRYKSLESVFNIMDPKLRESALRARPGNTVLTTRHGDKLTAEQIYQAAESRGLFPRATNLEDLVGDQSPAFGTFGSKFQPFGGRVYDTATKASELREHWVRLAHFVDVLGKSRSPLPIAIEQATRRVKKFHPDGMDLTGFEQNILRRVIPFYSWLRKATPLVIEGAIMRPQVTLAFPKAMADLQIATGVESQGPGNPFPMDQMFPDWLKEKGIGPILQPGSGLGRQATWRGSSPGYTIVNPSTPFLDQLQQLGNPKQTLLSGLTPAARIPLELLTGNTALGIPISSQEGGTAGYLASQVPAVGLGLRLTGMNRDNEPYNPEQLINYLTGMGITGTGPYTSQSRIEIQDLIKQMAKKNRGDYT
jgi:hypothetical protein